MKNIFVTFSVLLLVYMFWPGPTKISDFKALPDSTKSTLEGDTIQIPNVSAYFSDIYRSFVVSFYGHDYQSLNHLPFPAIKLNHPPEYSWVTIKKHTDSTYLEEFVYPLKSSIYVNGFEPFNPDATPKFWGSTRFVSDDKVFFTKTTLRFYPSSSITRIIVWLGIVSSVFLLYKSSRRILI